MRVHLAHHDALLREALERHGGHVFKTIGDAFCSAFADPQEALTAAAEVQRALAQTDWGDIGELRVRIAVHTGAVEMRGGDYFGPALNRVARLLSATHGGQVLCTDATERLARDRLPTDFGFNDLGEWSLKDIQQPLRIYQLSFPGMLALYASPSPRTLVPNNLPEELSSFIGRKNELQQVKKVLRDSRIVSIVGPGGVGKTRLAMRAGAALCEEFTGGVWFIDLSGQRDDADVALAVAKAMNLPPNRDTLRALLQHIGSSRTLLVLDSSEYANKQCAAFAKDILEGTAAARIIVTAHQPLHLQGEHILTLQPLSLPERWMDLEQVRRYDAIKLFVERASAADPHFKLTERTCESVVSICAALEGIPLALELAAARARALTLSQIFERLKERFAFLTGGAAETGHHRTLRGTIDWSYELLAEEERRFFARLSIMHGAFTLETAEAICVGEPIEQAAIVDLLQQLVEKSFLNVVGNRESRRFRMLDTIRLYAHERLRATDEHHELAHRHFNHFFTMVAGLQEASGDERVAILDDIEESHADVLAALDYALERDHPQLAEFALGLVPFWNIRGYLSEGAARLELVSQKQTESDRTTADLLVHASSLRNAAGESETARQDAEDAVRMAETLGDDSARASAQSALASVLANAGSYEQAYQMYLAAIEFQERSGEFSAWMRGLINAGLMLTAVGRFDEANAILSRAVDLAPVVKDSRMEAYVYGALGNVAHQSGALHEARRNYGVCLRISRANGDKFLIATALNHLAEVALVLGDVSEARTYIEESLRIAREHTLLLQLGDALEATARLMVMQHDDAVAAQLFGAVDTLRRRTLFPFTEPELRAREECINELRQRHGTGWYEAERDQGGARALETSVRLARSSLVRRSAARPKVERESKAL